MTVPRRCDRPGADEPSLRPSHGTLGIRGWPERMLGSPTVELAEDAVLGVVERGPWMSWDGSAIPVGALGVLVDDVVGSAVMRGLTAEVSGVSSEITIDTLSPADTRGGRFLGSARCEHVDGRGGFAAARITTENGALVAVATSRLRFVPADPSPPCDAPPGAVDDRGGTVERLLWPAGDVPDRQPDGRVTLRVGPRLVNHYGILHGGISLLLADRMATAATRRAGDTLSVASIHMRFPRRIPAGTILTLDTTVVHRGRSSGLVEVRGLNEAGRPGTIATVTLH